MLTEPAEKGEVLEETIVKLVHILLIMTDKISFNQSYAIHFFGI
jgi:hypothetical protein